MAPPDLPVRKFHQAQVACKRVGDRLKSANGTATKLSRRLPTGSERVYSQPGFVLNNSAADRKD